MDILEILCIFNFFLLFLHKLDAGAGDTLMTQDDNTQTETDALLSPDEEKHTERRLSRDIGTQAYSIDFEKEKPTIQFSKSSLSQHITLPETRDKEINVSLRKSMNLNLRKLNKSEIV